MVLLDRRVDPLLEDAGRLGLGERHDGADEVAARHRRGVGRDELVDQQDREPPLLLLGFRRSGRHDGRHDRRRRACAAASSTSASAAPSACPGGRGLFGAPLFLAVLRVVDAQAAAGPARLRDEVLEQEDVVAQMWRLAELVGERQIARDEIDLLVLVLERLAQGVQIAVAGHDEPDLNVRPILVQELHRASDEDRVGPAFEQPAAHALGHRDRLDAGELERHEQGLVLHRDLLSEDRELHAHRAEFGGLLEDGLQDREG